MTTQIVEQYTTDIKITEGNVDFNFTGVRNGVTTTVTSAGPLAEADANTQQLVEQSRAYFASAQANVTLDVEAAQSAAAAAAAATE